MPDAHADIENSPGPGEGTMQGPGNQGAQPGRTAGHRSATSTYRGVCWHRKSRRWQSAINISGKHIYLGSFDTEEEAARTFDKVAIRVRGLKAKLNFPSQDYLGPEGYLSCEPQLERLVSEARKALLEKQRCQERDARDQREQFAAESKRRRLLAGSDTPARLINGPGVYTGPRGMVMPPGTEMELSGLDAGWGNTDLSGIAALHPHLPVADAMAAAVAATVTGRHGRAGSAGVNGGGVWLLQQQQQEQQQRKGEVRQSQLRHMQRQQPGWRASSEDGGWADRDGGMYGDDMGTAGGTTDAFHLGYSDTPSGKGHQPYYEELLSSVSEGIPQMASLRRHHLLPLQPALTGPVVQLLGPCGLSSRASGAAPGGVSAPGLMQVQTLVQPPPRRGLPSDPGESSDWRRNAVAGSGGGKAASACRRDGPLTAAGAAFRKIEKSGGALRFTCQPDSGGGDGPNEGGTASGGLLALIARFLSGVAGELPRGCNVESLVPCSDPQLLGYTYIRGEAGQGQGGLEGEGAGGEAATAGNRTSQPLRGRAEGGTGGAGVYFRGMYRDLGLYSTTVDAMQACKSCMAVLLDCRQMMETEAAAAAAVLPQPQLLSQTQAALVGSHQQTDIETPPAASNAVELVGGSFTRLSDRDYQMGQTEAGASGAQPPHRQAAPKRRPSPPGSEQEPSSTAERNYSGQDMRSASIWAHLRPPTTINDPRFYQGKLLGGGTGSGGPGVQRGQGSWRVPVTDGGSDAAAKESRDTRSGDGCGCGNAEQAPACRTDQVGGGAGPQAAGVSSQTRSPPAPPAAAAATQPSSSVLESTPQVLQLLLQLLGAASRSVPQQGPELRQEQQRRQTGAHVEEGQDEVVEAKGRCESPSGRLLWRAMPVRHGVPLQAGSNVDNMGEALRQYGEERFTAAADVLCAQQRGATTTGTIGDVQKLDEWGGEDFRGTSVGLMQLQDLGAGGKVDCAGGAGCGFGRVDDLGGSGGGGDRRSKQFASKDSSDSTSETTGGRCRQAALDS